jgi:hypothetical protein
MAIEMGEKKKVYECHTESLDTGSRRLLTEINPHYRLPSDHPVSALLDRLR